jgi:hypothetical protein
MWVDSGLGYHFRAWRWIVAQFEMRQDLAD